MENDKIGIIKNPTKLILENHTDLPMTTFFNLVQKVINMGKISDDGKQYCYMTAFEIDGCVYHIVSDINKKSDKLTLYKSRNNLNKKD